MQRADHPASLFISIGEAAHLVGVSPATLRAWERRGLFTTTRSPAGYRRFTLTDIERLQRLQRSSGRDEFADERDEEPPPAYPEESGALSDRGGTPPVRWGAHLRDQRLQRKLSLRQVAALTGLSASFISGIERGLANPSVAALQKLTAAYGVSIVDLVEGALAPRGCLVRLADRQRYDSADGVTMDQLNFGNHLMELHLFTVDPGTVTGGPFHHEGEEFIMMLEGILRVSIDSLEHYVLEPGDVLYFESFHWHEWVNPGPTPAVFLGVNTPWTF
jgi:transcriptional regulator with XRE-family HTH domain